MMWHKEKENHNPTRRQTVLWDLRYLRQQAEELESQYRMNYLSENDYLDRVKEISAKVDDLENKFRILSEKGALDESI